ncbi:MAG: GGDEF domain-containing protein [Actinomycetota bacterium]|nr:GGDEF domain-containing protein [Actinomycetota bacterium]
MTGATGTGRRRGIRRTWAVAVGVPLVVVLAVGAWTFVLMRNQRDDFERTSNVAEAELATIAGVQRELLEAESPLGGVLYEIYRSGTLDEQWDQWTAHATAIDAELDRLADILEGDDAGLLADARASWAGVNDGVDTARSLWGTGEVAASLAEGEDPFAESVWAPLKQTELALASLAVSTVDDLRESSDRAEHDQSAAERLFAAALFAALVLGAASAWLLSVRVIRPLVSLQHVVARFRRGELDEPVEVSAHAGREIATLAGAMADMADSLQRSQSRLRTQAYTDGLTGLANRRAFTETLEQCAASDRERIAVVLIDVDDFKCLNDTRGHHAGDELLVHVARTLRSAVREGEDLVARLGGDEFAVVVRAAEPLGAASRIATRVLDRLGAGFAVDGVGTSVGVSIGIADGAGAIDADEIVRRSDAAMYAAKRRGKGTVAVHDPAAEDDAAAPAMDAGTSAAGAR